MSVGVGKVDEKATQLHAIASLKVLLDATKPGGGGPGGSGAGAAASTASTTASAASATSAPIVDLPNGQPPDPLDLVTNVFSSQNFYLILFNENSRFIADKTQNVIDFAK